MSGTSLDGLDLALCHFSAENGSITYNLLAAETITYEPVWKERLKNAYDATAEQYFKLHSLYGAYIAEQVTQFLKKNKQKAHYIASHGHTVFHRPQLGFSTQMGCGATIAAHTGIDAICDFRSLDVALQGQGAPLVPIGDRDLFPNSESCLNIGGIANISFTKNSITSAFDICIANMALNYLAEKLGKSYDANGDMARKGQVNKAMLADLLNLHTDQRSLGKEWFESHFLPVLEKHECGIENQLATCVEYIALQVKHILETNGLHSVLITGGGAYHTFLIDTLRSHYKGNIEIPADEVIQFKEAIIFAYLGYLRSENTVNTLNTVTKAIRNSCGGAIYKAS
jgi:anhydro-N-acetylmuramic acid kinase